MTIAMRVTAMGDSPQDPNNPTSSTTAPQQQPQPPAAPPHAAPLQAGGSSPQEQQPQPQATTSTQQASVSETCETETVGTSSSTLLEEGGGGDGGSSAGSSSTERERSGSLEVVEGAEPDFPHAELAKLDEMINRPRWVVPVLPNGELEVLLDAAIALCEKGQPALPYMQPTTF